MKRTLAVLFALVVSFFFTAVPASAGQWLEGAFQQHAGVCSDLFGSYNIVLTQEYTGYFGANDFSSPKVGEVYYAHVVVGNVSSLPCLPSQLMHMEIILPPNTAPAVDQAHPIYCFYVSNTTGVRSAMPQGTFPHYFCPGTAAIGTGVFGGSVDLGWVDIARGAIWEVQLPVVSTSQLHGIASANDKLTAGVNMVAGDGSGWANPSAWVTVAENPPTIGYPSPSSLNITNNSMRTAAYLHNNYLSGSIYFESGEVPLDPLNNYPDKTTPSAISGSFNYYSNIWADWSNATPNTLHHWRMCFTPIGGATICGVEQFVTTLAVSPSGTSYTLSVSADLGGTAGSGGAFAGGTSSGNITATPEAGYTFAGWYLDGAADGSANPHPPIVMNANHVLRAAFTPSTAASGGANLAVTMSGPSVPVLAGGNLTYVVTVTNGGPTDATSVVLKDTLPAGVAFVSASPGSPTCTQAGGVVTCNLGTIANGASTAVTIVVTTSSAGTLNNQATVASAVTDPVSINNSAALHVVAAATANLTLAAGPHALAATTSAVKGATNVPMAQFVISAATGTEELLIGKVTLEAGGTGKEASDVTSVKLYLDTNGDGVVDAGDRLLSSGTYTTASRTLTLTAAGLGVKATSPQTLLVVYDFNTTLAALPFTAFPVAALPLAFAGIVALKRPRYLIFALLLTVSLAGVYSCGGGGGGGGGTPTANANPDTGGTNNNPNLNPNPDSGGGTNPTPVPNANPTPTTGGGTVPASTFHVSISSIVGKGAVSGTPSVIAGLPVAGTTVTVNK